MQDIFSDAWKMAIVCPIPKVKNPTLPKDFRLISILSALSKVLERVACEQIQEY